MRCPLSTNKFTWECCEKECALWSLVYNMCSIKAYLVGGVQSGINVRAEAQKEGD